MDEVKQALKNSVHTFTTASSASGATPVTPRAPVAAIVPATCVPWLK